jgi:signal recognition particle receptor subunit beta
MKTLRAVVAGPVSSGKSTFVQTASETDLIETERLSTDSTSLLKPQTTVAFDFSRLILSPEMEMHIYGTPGQSRFDFMWDLLIKRAEGYILLVAAHRPDDLPSAREILVYMHQRVQLPMIVGITHTDCPNARSVAEIIDALDYLDKEKPPMVMTVDPMNKTSVLKVVMKLKSLILGETDVR